jgi:hypothetical protein
MTTFTETAHELTWLKREYDQLFNREEVTVASGNTLADGTVLGIITASSKYAAYDDTAVDGTEVAVGILMGDVDASGADAAGVALVRGPAVVSEDDLVGLDAAGAAELVALGIVIRATA